MILVSAWSMPVVLPLVAALAYGVGAAAVSRRWSWWVLTLAWLLHGVALGLSLSTAAPRFGFAPALSVTAWLLLLVYAIEMRLVPLLPARRVLGLLGAAGVLVALAFPGAPLHATASPWLVWHLAFGLASYGLLAAAVVHALWMTRAERRMRVGAPGGMDADSGEAPLLTLERLTFGLTGLGLVLLSATLLAGFFFSEQLYGKPWRWDHKTVLSVLAWFVLTTLVLGRLRLGWRGRKALRMLYLSAGLLLLSYAGSRFVLEVILQRSA